MNKLSKWFRDNCKDVGHENYAKIQQMIQNQPKYGVIDYMGADGHPHRDKVQK